MWSMLRPGLALSIVVAGGCTDGEAPPLTGADFSATVADMARAPDLLDVDGGGGGMACTTVCDCPTGNNCEAGFCVAGTVTLFCCGKPECTGTNACQHSNGVVSQCSNRPTPEWRSDAGAGNACSTIACTARLG